MKKLGLVIAAAFAAVLLTAATDDPSDQLPNKVQEQRAEDLFEQFRCVVCQNESIGASEADIAHDMRMLVRQQISAGKTDADIKNYMYARYGPFILLKPRLTPATAILWGGPFLIVLVGLGFLVLRRRRSAPLETDLSPEELAALKALETETKDVGPA